MSHLLTARHFLLQFLACPITKITTWKHGLSQKAITLGTTLEVPLVMRKDNTNIRKMIQLSRDMLILADEGQAAAEDDGCRLLFGIVQDCAYKIRLEAEREQRGHQRNGLWEEP